MFPSVIKWPGRVLSNIVESASLQIKGHGPVSQKSRKLFGPEKQFVKLRSVHFEESLNMFSTPEKKKLQSCLT